jgi:hypothetical protein
VPIRCAFNIFLVPIYLSLPEVQNLGHDTDDRSRFCSILAHLQSCPTAHLRYFSKANQLSAESLKSFADHLKEKCNNVLVMAGAGLSTPSGIPDFR